MVVSPLQPGYDGGAVEMILSAVEGFHHRLDVQLHGVVEVGGLRSDLQKSLDIVSFTKGNPIYIVQHVYAQEATSARLYGIDII